MKPVALTPSLQAKIIAEMSKIPVFSRLEMENLEKIVSIGQPVRFPADTVLLEQGTASDFFFLLLEGEASVFSERASGDRFQLVQLVPPCTLGEIGLLLQKHRTATVTATAEGLGFKFNRDAFHKMFQKVPGFSLALTRGLAERLDEVSGSLPLPAYDSENRPEDSDVANLLPGAFQQRHRVVPLHLEGNQLTIGFLSDPDSTTMTGIHKQLPGLSLRPVRIKADYFKKIMSSRAGIPGWSDIAVLPEKTAKEISSKPKSKLDALLERAVAEGASDLHLHAGKQPRWRIDGDLVPIRDTASVGDEEVLQLLNPVMEPRHRAEFDDQCDTDFAYAIDQLARFRINVFRESRGISASFRLIPSRVFTLDQLGFPAVVKSFCEAPKGLVVVTGPTGSGKSTTLAAMIHHLTQSRRHHVMTLEDPIEFIHEDHQSLVSQREIGGHTPTYARALRSALREDPDVVLVGEMRDSETLNMVLETANTGHLVLTTMHTNSAVSTIDRIIDMYPGSQQNQIRNSIADELVGVLSQTLCKRAGGGRVAAFEIMVMTRPIANLIREGKTIQVINLLQSGKREGQVMLNESLAGLVKDKVIEKEEALSKTADKKDLERRLLT